MSRFVYIVEDEVAVRESLRALLQTRGGLHLVPFRSGDAFLTALDHHEPGCVLVDLLLPDMNGIDLMERVALRQDRWPMVVLTGHGDVPSAVRAMKLGAVDYLEKPCRPEQLFAAVDESHRQLERRQAEVERSRDARQRFDRLSRREREVLDIVLEGCSNKQIAERLEISLRTVEVHRASLMNKLEVTSVAALVRAALAVHRPAPHAVNH